MRQRTQFANPFASAEVNLRHYIIVRPYIWRKEDERGVVKTAQCAVLPREMSLRKEKGAGGARTRRCPYTV